MLLASFRRSFERHPNFKNVLLGLIDHYDLMDKIVSNANNYDFYYNLYRANVNPDDGVGNSMIRGFFEVYEAFQLLDNVEGQCFMYYIQFIVMVQSRMTTEFDEICYIQHRLSSMFDSYNDHFEKYLKSEGLFCQ